MGYPDITTVHQTDPSWEATLGYRLPSYKKQFEELEVQKTLCSFIHWVFFWDFGNFPQQIKKLPGKKKSALLVTILVFPSLKLGEKTPEKVGAEKWIL